MNEANKLLSKNAQSLQASLREKGLPFQVLELAESTRTATEAAATIGCKVEQIIKSLIFQEQQTLKPILILASGANRVDEKVVATMTGIHITKANADYTRAVTGFAIGGIPPFGHKQTITTLIDKDLLQYDQLWAAAGTPNAVFNIPAQTLIEITQGMIIPIK
jgi:prolyl-tRNA editing enzyme YbaK/EbsC (Cys-tRNA(Pro) deacylase)